MTDLTAALAAATAKANELLDTNPDDHETPDEVFAPRGDTNRRFNTAWRNAVRESKEGSP